MYSNNQIRNAVDTTSKLSENSNTDTTEETITKNTFGYFNPDPNNYSYLGRNIGSSVGFALALGYAFKVKSGFWKGWGYTILGSMALGGIGYGVGMAIKKNKKTETK